MQKILCARCDSEVIFKEVSEGYFCVCPEHDEDLFEFETYQNKTNERDDKK